MWNNVELLTSDDTGSGHINGGSRKENVTALYQVDLLGRISSEKASLNPKIQACSLSDGFIIVADQTVILLDRTCRTLQLHLIFDTVVDVVGLCQEGKFLLVGERSGNLHLIHVTSKQTLFTKAFVKRDNDEYQRTYHNFIIEKDGSNEGTYYMLLLTNNGFFYITNLQLSQIEQAIENTDLDLAKKLQGQFKCSFISTENYHNLGCLNLVAGEFASETPVIIGGAGSCAFSKWESDSTKKEMSLKNFVDTEIVKGAKSFQLIDNLLFVLDTDNVLSLWDAYTLTPVWNWPSLPIEQFLLTTEADSPSSVTWQGIANLKLVTLTATTKEKMRSLIIFSLPSMEILYSLEVSSVSSLVQTGISTDTIYLLEGIHKNDPNLSEDSVSDLVLRYLTEVLPENRLRRLLHKHRFAEAESFAIQFGLDVELVYKVKSNDILEKLALISLDTSEQTKWQQLVEEAQENLCKIQDDDFVVNFCLKAQWITYETTQEMLSYAKARLLKKEDKTLPAYSDGFMEVLKAHAKLTTFYGAFGPEKFSGSSWIEFLNSEDVLGDIFMQLREGNLVCAQYLWLRHRADFESKFDVKMLENLLNSISTQVSLEKLCSWFKNDVIPFVRRIVPEGQNILAKWLEQASRNLELTDKANWPENGLQLAEVFFTAEKTEKFGFASSWHWISWKDYQNTEEVQQLQTLVIKLQELITLHKKYNCKLSLSEFEKENTTTIVFRMIDRVSAPELIPSVLEKFVRVYMREQNLQEELLLLYIEDLLKRCSSKSATLFDTAWEAKAMAVIRCLSDIDLIFDAVLKIMYKAVVPWSAAVEQLVKQHLEMDHPKVKLLQESYKLMEMKKLLRGYGIREVNLLNKEIMRVVRYILKQDTPSSLEDALKVAQGYRLSDDEIYSLRIIDLIDREQRDDCLLLLRSLPPVEAEKTAERVIIWARLALQEEPDGSEEDKAWRMSVAKTSVDILKILCDIQKVTGNLQKKDDSEEFLKQFKVVASLQENFEVFLPFEDYSNSTLVADLREQYIKAHEDAQAEHKLRGPPGPTLARGTDLSIKSKLHRQALALQVSAQELEAELALRALKHGKVGAALSKCRYLLNYYCNADTGRLLFLVCQKLCHMLANDVPMTAPVGLNLPSEIHDLACQAATLCSTDTLLDALELSKYTLTAVELSRQCQMDDSGILMKAAFGTHKDPYEEWSYSDFFSEDGIVLESQVVLPVIYELISSVVPLAESKRYPLDSISLPYCSTSKGDNLILPIVRSISTLLWNLQESSQWEMALRFVIGSFGACLQHSMSNIMSASLSEKLLGETTMANSKQIVVELKEKSVMFIRGNATTLLHKVFNCRLVDLDLALAYCTLLPQKDVFENLWKLIDKAWQNYNKILALSLVGSQLANLYQDIETGLRFHELSIDAQWGIRLGKLGISFQPAFRQSFLTKKDLLKALVNNIDMDTSLILEYCSTFQLDSDAALQLFIETLLHNTNNQSQGDASLEPTKQQHSRLLAKATEMVPLLASTKDLVVSLTGILYKLDPYDYEMIEVVLKVIEQANEKITSVNINQALNLLRHLKSYKRISPPVDLEYQYMLEHVITLPPAAQTRLPFHLILFGTAQNFWKILSSELSEESLPTLLLISKLMKFSLDTLYVSTAKHVFEKNLKPKLLKLAQAQSALMSKEVDKLTQTIESYLLSIVNPEWAVAIAISLTQEIPEGPFKMTSLKFCLYLAERWLQNIPSQDETREKAQALLKKLYLQFRRSGTEAVLIAHKLNVPEYLRVVGKPAHLIVSLYEHPSISGRLRNTSGKDYPDIHEAAKEIAEVNEINLEKIWDMLLEKWLCPSTVPSEKASEFFELEEDEVLHRVVYLLQSRPIDYSSRMLFVFAISATSTLGMRQLTFAHKTRALQCLFYLADKEMIESLFKKPTEEIKSYLKCITFLASFETLNIPITYELFCNSPKEGMIKGLWKNHSHESMAVRLVAELCLEYKIYDLQLWNGLLQKLLGFNMIPYLRKVLSSISSVHSLWQVPYFSRAWQCVIQIPLLSASCPLRPSQLSDCCESLVAILECPVSDDLDMIGVAKQYVQLELPAFALACLMLMPHSEKRQQQIKNFLDSCDAQIILQQLEEHMSTGQLAGFSHQIRSLILNHVINKKEFGILAKTKYFQLLKWHMINTNNITELVNYLANDLSLDEASALIIEYSKHCGKSVPSDAAPCEILKTFLGGSS
ncbi:kinetochore-associated protein 1 isoform X2 [Cricetulus griseus]|uniref:Kinetochore associated 1 n=1 Tax=Cricetulus griseus TaxID=10029 RepID=A0A8C2M0U5_CRIGR|nr:kinetochore-associated protein 1 isoform X2 [Cricetulus griseus]XP_027269767.1 kinetochore-associated protein 1 isoform X5 [Cricetulus griseus]